jgi:hypothetical protein
MALVIFALFSIIGQILNVTLCLALDRIFSPTVGALAFVLLYMLVFAGAWMLTLMVVDRPHAVPATQPR